ncbi:LADA_0B04016g1_1 [Lachancea dasiensis]|uniref:LADA_0B04016g1_1 n=1 Tax=Lachancea dasiensis TaxID=1072105 RepID=A0A1G4ISM8_9SACH|nr:LADA_0B04016g1_1 [Lachancea dasiensis]
MSYSQLASYLEGEIDSMPGISVPESNDIPSDLAVLIQSQLAQELATLRQENFKPVKQDELLLKIQENERALLRQDLHKLMATVGDLPREAIGTDLIELQEPRDGKFMSIEQLIIDIGNLPQISLANNEDAESESLLNEYNSLREGLKDKVSSIRDAEKLIPQLLRPLNQLKDLKTAVEHESGDAELYFSSYQENVIAQAQETARLLETVLKKNGELPTTAIDELKEIISLLEMMR